MQLHIVIHTIHSVSFKCVLVNISEAPHNYNFEIKKEDNYLENQQNRKNELILCFQWN